MDSLNAVGRQEAMQKLEYEKRKREADRRKKELEEKKEKNELEEKKEKNELEEKESDKSKVSGWPLIWSPGGQVPKFINLTKIKKVSQNPYTDTCYQKFVNLEFPLDNFRVYVSENEYVLAKLPEVKARWSTGKKLLTSNTNQDIRKVAFDYKKEIYFAMISGMYVASFLCGVSLLNLSDRDTPKIIRSIAQYHLYYQTRKFMKSPKLLDKYDLTNVKKYMPVEYHHHLSSDLKNLFYYAVVDVTEIGSQDYYGFIAYQSNGLTEIGGELLQQSIESYVYCVLGAQAKTRWSIVSQGGKSLQTQTVFRKLVEDTVIQSDISVSISNMRRAIADTNVTLNTSITNGVPLIPYRMIILEKKIAGYNNILTQANENMKFGVNSSLNLLNQKTIPKKYIKQTNQLSI